MISLRRAMQVDAWRLAEAGNHRAIADSMISMPSPFLPADAEAWIALTLERSQVDGYVIADLEGSVVGAAELRDIDLQHRQAEASFWVTPAAWGRGYASAALLQLTRFAFERHALNRVYAYHMVRNPGSGRVMAKCGFQLEGSLRQRVWKLGQAEDVMLWSRLAGDPLPACPG